jgi:hypothetical protein
VEENGLKAFGTGWYQQPVTFSTGSQQQPVPKVFAEFRFFLFCSFNLSYRFCPPTGTKGIF